LNCYLGTMTVSTIAVEEFTLAVNETMFE